MMMEMYFHFRIEEPILFKQWTPATMTAYVFSCVGVAVIAAAYEAIRFSRTRIQPVEVAEPSCCAEDVSHLHPSNEPLRTELPFSVHSLTRGQHVASTIVYFIQMYVAYSLMMISMTYNVPIVLSMVLGHIVAFFFLGPLISVKDSENMGDCCG